MKLKPAVRNRLEMLRKEVAAELPPVEVGNRKWIAVSPVPERHPNDPTPRPPGRFRIRQFELQASLVSETYAPYDGDLQELVDLWADSVDEVEQSLIALGVDPSVLDAPWKCDYPL